MRRQRKGSFVEIISSKGPGDTKTDVIFLRGFICIITIDFKKPCCENLDHENATADSIKEKIDNLLAYIDFELGGFSIGGEE